MHFIVLTYTVSIYDRATERLYNAHPRPHTHHLPVDSIDTHASVSGALALVKNYTFTQKLSPLPTFNISVYRS